MYVRHLQVSDFRSWAHADLELEPGATVLIGQNGQGKTNLVEALGYLATLGSHRVAVDAPLVRSGAERAVVRAVVVRDDRDLTLEVEILRDARADDAGTSVRLSCPRTSPCSAPASPARACARDRSADDYAQRP